MNANISLRDYFAGLAMQVLLNEHGTTKLDLNDMRYIAEAAYLMADEMARESVK